MQAKTLKNLIQKLDHIEFQGDKNIKIIGITDLNDNSESSGLIRWASHKNVHNLPNLKKGTFILDIKSKDDLILNKNCNYIFVKSPRYAFQCTLNLLYSNRIKWGTSQNAIVHESVKVAPEVFIGYNVVIHENCQIEKNVIIHDNTVIYAHTIIEEGVTIGSNCTIGAVGFGYERNPSGAYELLPHIGNVKIKKNAHIGNNTCIDRAVMGSTIIGQNVKIDNLVHIAHGVEILDNSLIIANAMIGGSVTIGKNVWVAPSSAIINKAKVGDDSLIGLGAVVIKNVENKSIVVGNPATPLRKKK